MNMKQQRKVEDVIKLSASDDIWDQLIMLMMPKVKNDTIIKK